MTSPYTTTYRKEVGHNWPWYSRVSLGAATFHSLSSSTTISSLQMVGEPQIYLAHLPLRCCIIACWTPLVMSLTQAYTIEFLAMQPTLTTRPAEIKRSTIEVQSPISAGSALTSKRKTGYPQSQPLTLLNRPKLSFLKGDGPSKSPPALLATAQQSSPIPSIPSTDYFSLTLSTHRQWQQQGPQNMPPARAWQLIEQHHYSNLIMPVKRSVMPTRAGSHRSLACTLL